MSYRIDEIGVINYTVTKARLVTIIVGSPLPWVICLVCTILLGIRLAQGRNEMAGNIRR